VLDAPAPVVAGALGYHQTTTTRQVAHAGGTWNRYPASETPSWHDQVRLIDAPLCRAAGPAKTVRRSDLAGWAGAACRPGCRGEAARAANVKPSKYLVLT